MVLSHGFIVDISSICYISRILIHTTAHFRFKYDTPTTSLVHQQQEDLRILAKNEPSLIVVRYCNIPSHSGSVAEASTRFCTHSNGKKHRKYRIILQSGGLQASISLLLYAPPDCKRQGLAKPLHWLLGEQEDVTLAGGTHRRAKITQNAQQRAGLVAKSTPPCPGGLALPTGCHMQKGGSVFVDV